MTPPIDLPRFALKNGTHVALRPIRPDDADALQHAFQLLSPRTRYQRFHAMVRELSPAWVRYLTEVDGHDHVALVAVRAGEIVGVGRCVRLAERDRGEVAFVVADELQAQGLGALLRDALIEEARRQGMVQFTAHVQPDNRAIRRLLTTGTLELTRDLGHELHLVARPVVPAERVSERTMRLRAAG